MIKIKEETKRVLIIAILLAIAIPLVSYVAYPFVVYSDTFSITGELLNASFDNGTMKLKIKNEGTMIVTCQDINTYNDINQNYVGNMFRIEYRINKINNCVEILRYGFYIVC